MNGGPTGEHDEVTGALAVGRGTELPAEGDDIVVIRRGPPPRPRTQRIVVAALAAVVVLAAAVAVVALTNDESSKEVQASEGTPTSARAAETTGAPRTTVVPTTVAVAVPVQPTTPPPTRAPVPATPAAPAPTAAVALAPDVSVSPAQATVSAGTPVVVTFRVHNGTDAPVTVSYDNDGCDPALVPPPDIGCTQVVRQLDVGPGAEASTTITIATDDAAPGVYEVAIGERSVRVTIV